MSRIIICYRPTDSQAITNRIYDHLCNTFGDPAVVLGTKALVRPGDDYLVAITNQVQAAQALVVVIGPNWAEGNWLDDANDMDRIALAAALNSQVRVVPVLVNGALPASRDLPSDLLGLARRVGLTMSDATFRQDAPKLVDSVIPSAPPPMQPPAPVGRGQPQSPPPSPVYGQPPLPAPQPYSGQVWPVTQKFSLDPEMVRIIVTGFAAIAGALMIIAFIAFSLVDDGYGNDLTPFEIIRADYGDEFASGDTRTIDYTLLLIPLGGVSFIATATAVYLRRIKTDHGLLSVAGTAALLFCIPFLWRFLDTNYTKSNLKDAGASPSEIDYLLDIYTDLYSIAEFIWIPVGIFAIALGGWSFLRFSPQLQLTIHQKATPPAIPGQPYQPPQPIVGGQPLQQPAPTGFGRPTPPVVINPTYFQAAGIVRRFTAFVIDMVIVGVTFFLPLLLFLEITNIYCVSCRIERYFGHYAGVNGARVFGGDVIVGFIFVWLLSAPYQIFFLARSGQTPGMKVANISVAHKQGWPLTIGTIIARTFIGYTFSTFVAFLGYIWVVFESENRTWHDHLTNTIVIESASAVPQQQPWNQPPHPPQPPMMPPRY